MDNFAEIAGKLTTAQREAIIGCVDALAEMAGDGFCVPEDAIFELACAFYMPSHLEYGEWVRAYLQEQGHG